MQLLSGPVSFYSYTSRNIEIFLFGDFHFYRGNRCDPCHPPLCRSWLGYIKSVLSDTERHDDNHLLYELPPNHVSRYVTTRYKFFKGLMHRVNFGAD